MSESETAGPKPTVVFYANPRMPVLTPLQNAQWEIDNLSSDPELQYNAVFGRPRNEEDATEEARRQTLYLERLVAIVKKYGVEEEFLKPLIEKRNRLWSELFELCATIKAIRA